MKSRNNKIRVTCEKRFFLIFLKSEKQKPRWWAFVRDLTKGDFCRVKMISRMDLYLKSRRIKQITEKQVII